jgi:hypothetical protein
MMSQFKPPTRCDRLFICHWNVASREERQNDNIEYVSSISHLSPFFPGAMNKSKIRSLEHLQEFAKIYLANLMFWQLLKRYAN